MYWLERTVLFNPGEAGQITDVADSVSVAEDDVCRLNRAGAEVDAGSQTTGHATRTVGLESTRCFTNAVQADRGIDASP